MLRKSFRILLFALLPNLACYAERFSDLQIFQNLVGEWEGKIISAETSPPSVVGKIKSTVSLSRNGNTVTVVSNIRVGPRSVRVTAVYSDLLEDGSFAVALIQTNQKRKEFKGRLGDKPGRYSITGSSQVWGGKYETFYTVGTDKLVAVTMAEDENGTYRIVQQGSAKKVEP